jgi:hypothetical protein
VEDRHGTAFAESVAAAGPEIDLVGQPALLQLFAEVIHQLLRPVGETPRPDAEGDAGFFRVASALQLFPVALQFLV